MECGGVIDGIGNRGSELLRLPATGDIKQEDRCGATVTGSAATRQISTVKAESEIPAPAVFDILRGVMRSQSVQRVREGFASGIDRPGFNDANPSPRQQMLANRMECDGLNVVPEARKTSY